MKILIDMNLSPDWVRAFTESDIEADHWSSIGSPSAPDTEILEHAMLNGYVVFTHDLDFGTLLAITHAELPSVIQVRTQDIMPAALAKRIISLILETESFLIGGALVVVDEARARVRILPLAKS